MACGFMNFTLFSIIFGSKKMEITKDELMKEACKRGIEVTDKELNKAIAKWENDGILKCVDNKLIRV